MPQSTPTPILFTSSHTGLGGGETSLFEMVRVLDKDQWTPHLLCPAEGQFPEIWREQGWPVHIIPWRHAMPYYIPMLWARFPIVQAMADLIRQEGIRVVRPEYHSVPFVAPACKLTGIPWVWMVHGQWAKPKPWQRGLYRQATHLFADSGWTKDGFLGDPPFMPAERVEVLHLGVDVNHFTPENADGTALREELGITPDAPVITILGRFQPIKGHLNFMAMAAQIVQEFPNVRFLVVGDNVLDGDIGDAHKQAVRDVVMGNPALQAACIFTGFTDDLTSVMGATDILAVASDFESFGMANLEAMACGKPVVSINNGGPAETVLDRETGYLVPPRDPAALTDGVRKLLADPEKRLAMGKAARQHVLNALDVRLYADRFSAVLEDVID